MAVAYSALVTGFCGSVGLVLTSGQLLGTAIAVCVKTVDATVGTLVGTDAEGGLTVAPAVATMVMLT